MKVPFEAKLEIPADAVPPDVWPQDNGVRLPNEHVISRKRNKEVLSRKGHLYWNLQPYHPRGKPCGVYFTYWQRSSRTKIDITCPAPSDHADRVSDMQHLLALVMYKRPGLPNAPEKVVRMGALLKHLAQYAAARQISIVVILSDESRLADWCHSVPDGRIADLSAFIGILLALDPVMDLGFEFAGKCVAKNIRARLAAYVGTQKQHAPVPTRIYSHLIAALATELETFESIAERYMELVNELCADSRNSRQPVSELITSFGLDDYFERQGLSKDGRGVGTGLTDVQIACKVTIQTFSGMRNQEALALPYECLEIEKDHGRTHYVLCGQTTKLNHGKIRRTKWVTSKDGHRAVRVARIIADAVYVAIGEKPSKSKQRLNRFPLFVSLAYFSWIAPTAPSNEDVYQASLLTFDKGSGKLLDRILPTITEQDLEELESIDPHRAWRSEPNFRVGERWVLKSHQLRRSLALYAQRSGLVSIPSLRRQLQHLTQEMSLYYAKGSYFAKNFIEDDAAEYKNHMCKEWRDTKPVSEALALLRDVLFAEEQIFGGAGAFFQGKKDRGEVVDRETIIKMFKKGEMAWKETAVGGCINTGQCKSVGLKFLDADCLKDHCPKQVIKLSKLETSIKSQTALLETLAPDSVEYRMEKSDLDVLITTRNECQERSERRSRG